MAKKKKQKRKKDVKKLKGIREIYVSGYKSILRKQCIEIRPLTILAGANNSGKTSIMQPLLLLKQTLEETYDPGPILLSGPMVKLYSTKQVLSKRIDGTYVKRFRIGMTTERGEKMTLSFRERIGKGFKIEEMCYSDKQENLRMRLGMPHKKIVRMLDPMLRGFARVFKGSKFEVTRNRCFLGFQLTKEEKYGSKRMGFIPTAMFEDYLRNLIHLPGLRGIVARVYPVTAVGERYPGTFEKYIASIIINWQLSKNRDKLREVTNDLKRLGLTWNIAAKEISDTYIEIEVGRLKEGKVKRTKDMVNIADVGSGVSQALPVVVALHTARPGQIVFIEQPELHLHPLAQNALAKVLANAANRGVRVVVETHSALLLLGIQAAVARGEILPSKVKLHWFLRGEDGVTKVKSADLDRAGAFGKWPEDFGRVSLESEKEYLDAAEKRLFQRT